MSAQPFLSAHTFIHFGSNPVVTVHEGDILSLAYAQAVLSGCGMAAVWLVKTADPVMGCGIFVTDGRRTVSGAVIYHNDFIRTDVSIPLAAYSFAKRATTLSVPPPGISGITNIGHRKEYRFLISERNDPDRYEHPRIRNFFYCPADRIVCQTQDAADAFPERIRKLRNASSGGFSQRYHFHFVTKRISRLMSRKKQDRRLNPSGCILCQTQDAADAFPERIRKKAMVIPNPVEIGETRCWSGERERHAAASVPPVVCPHPADPGYPLRNASSGGMTS